MATGTATIEQRIERVIDDRLRMAPVVEPAAEESVVYGPFEGEPCRGRPYMVLQGVARCANCVAIEGHRTDGPTIMVLGAFPWENPLFQDGYHCGDALVAPKWNQPKAARVGYGGPTKMVAYLPGGSKYTGAMYEGDELAAGPVRGPKRASRIATANVVAVEEVRQASVPALAEDPEPPEEQFKDGFAIKIGGWITSPARVETPVQMRKRLLAPIAPVEAAARNEERLEAALSANPAPKCPACKGEGSRKRKRWAGRWNGIGDPYRISKCRTCKGTGSADGISQQPRRDSSPAAPGSSLRALSELMGEKTPGEEAAAQSPRSQRTGDVESWMRNYLGMQPSEAVQVGRDQLSTEEALAQERALTARQYADIEQLKANRQRWIEDYQAGQTELDGKEEIIRGLRSELENAKNDLGLMYAELVRVREGVADGTTTIEGECRELVSA